MLAGLGHWGGQRRGHPCFDHAHIGYVTPARLASNQLHLRKGIQVAAELAGVCIGIRAGELCPYGSSC